MATVAPKMMELVSSGASAATALVATALTAAVLVAAVLAAAVLAAAVLAATALLASALAGAAALLGCRKSKVALRAAATLAALISSSWTRWPKSSVKTRPRLSLIKVEVWRWASKPKTVVPGAFGLKTLPLAELLGCATGSLLIIVLTVGACAG